jgi:hypothetical protein
MLRLWREPSLADRYGRMGRLRVEDHFNVVSMVQNYESIYRELLDRCPARGMQLQGVGGC